MEFMPSIIIKEETIKPNTVKVGSLVPGELFRRVEHGAIYMLSSCPSTRGWQAINMVNGSSEYISLKDEVYPIFGEATLTITSKKS